ncbi:MULTISPECIES: flagellar export chaperone FliS [Pseudomonas]|mgnify:FL=1|jgi:flagellar secretion chaperone FliS|uniref:Flagellar secretion chaperone FliS n=1 Tax=Pseudomonas lundensis TaxID=86185 RepID=A0AAP7CY84_9PSED|nr:MULTISPECIES: flagellar export chaperone FliS [Pseudomonas]AOZ14361.1 flagellar export chaperone FliS [Pseudomonas lundensis]MBM1183988.1 flagellar export chaperone FliS [Pseudomonas lundensis]NLU03261.1 flagellar export chaperone FliS [Pseudomonas lundensis]NMZ52722.1 flagellar export chaperone FliS [Pseudomonas lundensis]NNA01589.1 flagellar export chaperone FliS [Pseudomonas lundensis]
MNPMRALRQYQKVNSHAQISEASPHRLIQMLMEGALERMAQAKGAMARGDIPQKALLITKTIDIITGLRAGLREENTDDKEALRQLDSLYEYMTKQLTLANAKNEPELIDEVARLLITVKSGWDAIAPE